MDGLNPAMDGGVEAATRRKEWGVSGPEIPDKLFFKIGEVCEIVGVEPYVLRFWESEFPSLSPQKSKSGHRVYRKKDVEMALRIKDLLYKRGFTIAGARKQMARDGAPEGRPVLRQIRKELRDILTLLNRNPKVGKD